MSGLRIMLAGGGTGGHLFPAVALAEAAVARGGEVRFVGTERGIEARVIPELGYGLDFVRVRGIKGRGLLGLVTGLARLPASFFESRRLLKRFGPDVVVGVGGHASGPLVLTAAMLGYRTAILEQNSVPGITNRILGRVVRRIFATFPDRLARFPAAKVQQLGNPVRKAIVERLAATSARTDGPPHLFIFGGSQGARPINDVAIAAVPRLLEVLPELTVRHQTGKADAERVAEAYRQAGCADRIQVDAFIADMASAYEAADLVVCRAGATSVCELAIAGRASVLIPFPQATDDHQTHNASALVDAGAAELLPQSELTAETFVTTCLPALRDHAVRVNMAEAARSVATPQAATAILDALAEL